ncbi:head GIN domain-containing protein [Sphingomonas sp.]|uniref:head GIN domain-containing protein n=1 Tax=Sphingomonas sp. TaxID=28214 RepID=UPI00307E6685
MRLLALPALFLTSAAAPVPQAAESNTVMLTGFERLRVDGPILVRVIDGQPPRAVVTGDRRALDRVSVRNMGGQLVIGPRNQTFEGWSAASGAVTVTVGARGLRGININGGGSVDVDRIGGQRVDLGVNGAGSLNIARLDADQLAVTLTGTGAVRVRGGMTRTARFGSYGAGSIDATGMTVNDLIVQAQSAGDSRFTARYTAQIATLGTGSVRVTGNAACTISGPGPASCTGKTDRRR